MEIVRINLDNEMDLILAHKRTMKLAELCGLSLSPQTTFATAISEIARCSIGHGEQSHLVLSIDAPRPNLKEITATIYDAVDLRAINSEALSYAKRLMGNLQTSSKDGFYEIRLTHRIQFGGTISPAKIQSFKDYFKNEPAISAYDEIRKKNIQLIELSEKLRESENQYRLLTDNLPIMMFVINQEGIITYANQWLKEFSDNKQASSFNLSWQSMVHPEDYKTVAHEWHKSFQSKTIFRTQARLKQKDKFIWHLISIIPIKNEKEVISNWIGSFVDINAQKLIEEALKDNKVLKKIQDELLDYQKELEIKNTTLTRQNDFIETVLDSSIDYIAVLDKDEKFVTFNQSYETLSGLEKAVVVGKQLTDIFPTIQGSKTYQDIQQALGGTLIHNPAYYSSENDKYLESFYIPLLDDYGDTYGVVMLIRDINDQILHEQKLKKINEELIKKNNELEQFAYIASHDLQEPLRKIKTFSLLLQKEFDFNERQNDIFNRIINSSNRMTELIKGVLNYSRLSVTEEFVETNLNEIIQNIQNDFELVLEEKNAQLISSSLPVIPGNPLQLSQLFSNLLSNSIKFSDKPPVISIQSKIMTKSEVKEIASLNPLKKYVQITFQDNGIGFEQQYVTKIFTIFQRLNNIQAYTGTGIGLALCKKIVENHHGFITASSELGQGATFEIYLPLFD